ncbi:MAG: transporter substrate-binding domain-containing protein [Desulfobacterales bacterium]|jgi:polar amino acid transport system substrate-binding protein
MKKVGFPIFPVLVAIVFFACSQHNLGTYVLTSPSPVLDRIQQRGELVVGTAAGMPPLSMTTKGGEIIGLDADLSRYLADAMEVKLRLEPMVFKDLLPSLEAGNIDMVISGMTMTAHRNLRVAFVGPYLISGKGLLTREATLAATKDPDAIDLAEVRLTALAGSTSADFVRTAIPRAQFVPAQDYDEAVKMVIDGRVDAMVADQPICLISVARYPDKGLLAVVAPLTYEPIGIALPANDALFINLVGNFLTSLRDTGTLERLKEQWFQKGDWWDQIK